MFFVIILTELAISNRTLDNEQPDSQPFVVGFNVLIVTYLNEKKNIDHQIHTKCKLCQSQQSLS